MEEQQVGQESWIIYASTRVPMVWGKCMTQKTFVGTEAGVKLREKGCNLGQGWCQWFGVNVWNTKRF